MSYAAAAALVLLATLATASPPPPHFYKGYPIKGPKVVRHVVVPHNKYHGHHPSPSRNLPKRHFSASAAFAKGCSECAKQGNWKPIIPPTKTYKQVMAAPSFIEPQPLLYHQASNLDSHPAQFHVTIERFPGPDDSLSPPKVTFASGPASVPWGEDSGSSSGSSSSGSSESSEELGGGGHFFHGGPPADLHQNRIPEEAPKAGYGQGNKDYAVHEQPNEPPAPRRRPKGGVQLLPNLVPSSTTMAPPTFPPSPPQFKLQPQGSNFYRRRRQPNVQIVPSRNVRVIHLKS